MLVATFSPQFSTPIGQPLVSLRQPFFVVPEDHLSLQSLTTVIAQPPEGDYSATVNLHLIRAGKHVPFAMTPVTITPETAAYLAAIEAELTDRDLEAGDVLLLDINVTHAGGTQQTHLGSNLYAVSGGPGSGLLVVAHIA